MGEIKILKKCYISDWGSVHNIYIYFFYCRADTDELVDNYNVNVTSGFGSLIRFRVEDLPAGEYDVRLITVGRTEKSNGMSTPSPPARFRVRASDPISITIIGSVAGSVGVVILIAVGIFVGAFFLCFYSHR